MARISIPCEDGFPVMLNALVKLSSFPFLEIEFPEGQAPDSGCGEDWLVIIDTGTNLVSIHAEMDSQLDCNRYHLRVLRSQYHTQARRHQRVEAEVYLRWLPAEKGLEEWAKPMRKKVDISPSGIRFTDRGLFRLGEKIQTEIFLPGAALEKVCFNGEVLRVSVKKDASQEVTMKIAEIDVSDIEKISAFCMAHQFRNMKSKAEELISFKKLPALSR